VPLWLRLKSVERQVQTSRPVRPGPDHRLKLFRRSGRAICLTINDPVVYGQHLLPDGVVDLDAELLFPEDRVTQSESSVSNRRSSIRLASGTIFADPCPNLQGQAVLSRDWVTRSATFWLLISTSPLVRVTVMRSHQTWAALLSCRTPAGLFDGVNARNETSGPSSSLHGLPPDGRRPLGD